VFVFFEEKNMKRKEGATETGHRFVKRKSHDFIKLVLSVHFLVGYLLTHAVKLLFTRATVGK